MNEWFPLYYSRIDRFRNRLLLFLCFNNQQSSLSTLPVELIKYIGEFL